MAAGTCSVTVIDSVLGQRRATVAWSIHGQCDDTLLDTGFQVGADEAVTKISSLMASSICSAVTR